MYFIFQVKNLVYTRIYEEQHKMINNYQFILLNTLVANCDRKQLVYLGRVKSKQLLVVSKVKAAG